MRKINLGAGACALVAGCLAVSSAFAEEKSATELLRDGLAVPVGCWSAREVVLKEIQ